jgi:hypothetical protein
MQVVVTKSGTITGGKIVTENEQRSQRQLAMWLRRRLEGHAPPEILAQISDEDLCRQYEEDKARKLKMIQEKEVVNRK